MKKALIIGVVLLVIGLAAVLVVAFSLGTIVRNGVNQIGPQLTKTSVVLEEAEISPFMSSGTLRGLHVGNPEGWSAGQAFALGEVQFDLEPMTLWKDPIVIDELVILRPEFAYEQRLTGGSNMKDLIENIRTAIGAPGERPIGEPEEPARRFIIRKLRLQEGQVRVGLGPAGANVPLPDLDYENLGVEEGGITGAQIAQVVLSDVLSRVISVATGKGILGGSANQTIEAVGGMLEKSGSGLQKLFGGKKDAPKEDEKND